MTTLNDFIEKKVAEWRNASDSGSTVDFLRTALRECAEKTVAELGRPTPAMGNPPDWLAQRARAWLGTDRIQNFKNNYRRLGEKVAEALSTPDTNESLEERHNGLPHD